MASSSSSQSSDRIPLWRDERVLRITAQVISAVVVIGGLIWVVLNLLEAAEQRGLSLGFDFIKDPEPGFRFHQGSRWLSYKRIRHPL
jgi:ABC-type amino acid transport system permease subunit